jgi:hypothetical protein
MPDDPQAAYFALTPPPTAANLRRAKYIDLNEVDPISLLSGLQFRAVLGGNLLLNFARYDPGTIVPLHAHAEEQLTFVVDGEFEFELAGDRRLMRPGAVAIVPPYVPHAAKALRVPCTQVDVFCPPRRALLDALGVRPADGE